VLEPDGRALLLDALRPPDGYILDSAVATTFTVHLESALSVALAFIPRRLADSADPIALMEAVRSAADRLDVFHQAGMAAAPQSHSSIVAFLEPVLHAVRRPKAGHLFHPKLWALRFVADEGEGVRMRLVVPSRNLTSDRSWDLLLQLDGELTDSADPVNEPVARLLEALPGLSVGEVSQVRRARIGRVADDVRRTRWELPQDMTDISFDVLGFGAVLEDDFFVGTRDVVVISPFLTPAGLATVTAGRPATVISRQATLDALPADTLAGHDVYVLDPLTSELVQAPDAGPPVATGLAGLHAKCYVLSYDRRTWIRVGSANATEAAFGGNAEIIVTLVGPSSKLGAAEMFGDDGPLRSILTTYTPQTPEDDDAELTRLDNVLVDLASGLFTVTVLGGDDAYRARFTGPALAPGEAGIEVSARMITLPGSDQPLRAGEPVDLTFGPMAIDEISAFVVLTATGPDGARARCLVLADLVDAPGGRLDAVIAGQVDTPEKFLRFLALLLGAGDSTFLMGAADAGDASRAVGVRFEAPGLFELLMRALVDHPDRLEDLARLVPKVAGAGVLPPGFAEIWAVVDAARAEGSGKQ
ncbi:Hypothetical protein KLENKIAIHU_3834, partial [Klenkia terrae]